MMRIVSAIAMFVLMGVAAQAQEAKIVAEIANSERMIKNAPFSAEAISESVQTLADGNRIVRSSTSKLYRNSEGRFRREMSGGSGGVLGSLYTIGENVTILDPVGGFRYMIDPNQKTTRQMIFKPAAPMSEFKLISPIDEKLKAELKAAVAAAGTTTADGALLSEKLKGEIKTAVAAAPVAATRAAVAGQFLAEGPIGGAVTAFSFRGSNAKWETRTEDLGTQNIEGVDAEGTRTITTIPAGAIGNERPIEITYERWHSRELQLVVMSKHNDPRFGEQTYRLTNIIRSEPDPSLFTPPNGYKLVTEPSSGGFTFTTAAGRATAVEKATRAVQASSPKARP